MRDKVLAFTEKVHNLRVAYNRDNIGFGFDKYSPQQEWHYDEAYAVWGLGYLNLYQLKNNISSLDLLDCIFEYLYASQRYDGSYGLPWDWQGQKKEEGYLITTSFIGLFLLGYYDLVNDSKVYNLIKQIEKYALSLKENRGSHTYLNYSKYMHEDVLNAYTKAILFLTLHDYERNKDLIERLVESIEDGQSETGGFLYILYPPHNIDVPDNYHQCFIINSLIRTDHFLRKLGEENHRIGKITNNSMNYFISNFFDQDLYLRKHAKKPLIGSNSFSYRRTLMLWAIGKAKRKLLRQPPSRSTPGFYDLGQTLALLSTDINRYSRYIESVVDQAEKKISSINDGYFFIRDMGHLFYGLTEVLLKLDLVE
jgi:hypothetical protein